MSGSAEDRRTLTDQPTRGAGVGPSGGAWTGRPGYARTLRILVVLAPPVFSLGLTWVAGPHLYRPGGWIGALVWVAQIAVIGLGSAIAVERLTRRVIPLVNLLGMTLTFPDQAPSRFGVALRSGTTRQLENEVQNLRQHGLSTDAAEAAEQLLVLVAALGKHERLTRGHTERVRAYSELIGQELKLSPRDQGLLRWGALIHDIGKLAVPAPILSKESQLDNNEWHTIKLHPEVGKALAQPLESWLGDWRLAASEHHERWDGLGYPLGLSGTDISLAGRIVAVADTYDVITSTRSYKSAMGADEGRKELVRCAGTQFDPDVVRAFLAVSVGRLHPIAGRFAWLANIGLLFQQAPAVIQAAAVGGVAAATLAGGLATGAIQAPDQPARGIPGLAAGRVVDTEPAGAGFVFPSIPAEADGQAATLGDSGSPPTVGPTQSGPVGTDTGSPSGTAPTTATSLPSASPATSSVPAGTAPPTTNLVAPTTIPIAATTTASPPNDCASAQSGILALTGADLAGCDLHGFDLSGAHLDGSDLTGADLIGADLTGAIVSGADLTGTVLRGARLDDARLSGADASGADFTDASMVRVRIGGADLTGANLTRADLTAAQGNPANPGSAIWVDTTCPSGAVQSTNCYR